MTVALICSAKNVAVGAHTAPLQLQLDIWRRNDHLRAWEIDN